jgi:hypothetical protein
VGGLEVEPFQKSEDVVQRHAGEIGFGEVIDDRSQVVAFGHPSRLARHPSPGDEIFRAYDEGNENRERFRIGLTANSRSTTRSFQFSASMCKPCARLNFEVSRSQVTSRSIPTMVSKLHHATFDANLIGIDPDYRIHISEPPLSMNDGPMFEQGLKALAGRELRRPKRDADRPDRDRLALRFASFRG